MKGNFKKPAQLMLVLVVAFSMLLSACTSNNKPESSNNGGTNNGGETKTPQEFRFTLGSEPPSLDPALMTDAQSSIVAAGLYEGLTRLNTSGEPENAIAKEITASEDGKTYTIKLRDDVKWSNGEAVTAHDFEYSWKRALAPETASEYAYMLYYLENGEKYNTGKGTVDEVGVKATDDYTLEVKLYTPAPYFPSLLAHYTYLPVNKSAVDGKPEWASEQETIVSNGPFLLKEWKHEDKLVLTKNPDYYNASAINFDKVTVTLINDENTVYNLFDTGKIDWIGAQAGSVPLDRTQQLVKDGKAEITSIASSYYYLFNTTKAPFNNVKVRKAFAMTVDRQSLIDNVAKANQQPAYGLVPPSITVDGKSFREMYPDTDFFKEDATEAKKLLEEGLAESGLKAMPEITLLYNTSEGHKAIAEAIVDMWRNSLGVEVKLANQEWATFLETRDAGQFDIARAGWGADINHPVNYTYDLIHPNSGNNDGKYNNPKVGELLDNSLVAETPEKSVEMMAEAEKIAMAEDMAVLPLYYYTTVTMLKDGFKNVVPDYSGNISWVFGGKE
ncbi:oligopeptide transport system substrate-binding protein [Paenibacillus endophyticus]|uniref:Oligopeptide transport system substrate-binding protein n=1 Tax=Paenibacillus endophyticus TaxID=1294268 RepID=A0A7W5GC79_9BACL|nr:peptide ABC transporter substrate-binding protein [Paenibacillus endophyticus]MBB3154555.1 oligopeptide transport system substrate-binding protein [Paenibacillus endophyticus]